MNLAQIRTEVLNHGFDPIYFGSSRIDSFINDGYLRICRRVNYYGTEATSDFSTVVGQATYPQPADFARDRSLRITSVPGELSATFLRSIDRADQTSSGRPGFYALDGLNLRLYPLPDAVYPMELRYWAQPPLLVADGDTPKLPADYHRLLWYWATKEGYAAEDDPEKAGYWEQQFNTGVSELAADLKHPNADSPHYIESMWDAPASVGAGLWQRRW